MQKAYSPIDYTFKWTQDNWYTFDEPVGKKQALADRRKDKKQLEAQGYKTRQFSLKSLMSKGGIGSGKPHIEVWTTAYYLEYWK